MQASSRDHVGYVAYAVKLRNMASGRALFAVILIFGMKSAWGACINVTQLSTRLDLMLAEYDRATPPGAPAAVAAALSVRHASIDERDATVRLMAIMYLTWMDGRLSWNASDWGCDSVAVSAERLWRPDVRVLSAAVEAAEDAGVRARLTAAGRITWAVPHDLEAPVTLNLRAWPADEQQITFKFGSQLHSSEELNLTVMEDQHSNIFESGAWEFTAIQSAESTWKRLDAEHTVVSWTVKLRRRAAAHALAAGSVLATAVLLLCGAMLLPPAERAPLCAVAAFTATLWLISCLPRLSSVSSAPLAMISLCVVSCVGAIGAVGAGLVRRLARRSSPPPSTLRRLLAAVSVYCSLEPKEGGSEHGAWAAAAQLLDYVLLATLGLTMLVVVCLHP